MDSLCYFNTCVRDLILFIRYSGNKVGTSNLYSGVSQPNVYSNIYEILQSERR